jgi:trimeric autotransporter adhesin
MLDNRRHQTVFSPALASGAFYPSNHRSGSLATGSLSGVTLRWLALAAGVSIAAAILWAVPAMGQQSLNGGTATGNFAYASGLAAIATGEFATATGVDSRAIGNCATAMGGHSHANGSCATATGYSSLANGLQATATGAASDAIGENATAMGHNSDANGTFATATGQDSIANGATASAYGQGSNATGDATTAIGQASQATATGATALGTGATAAFTNSTAIGNGATTTAANQVSIGTASNTYRMSGITSAASRAAQSGPTSLVTTDANGNLAAAGFSGQDISLLQSNVATLQTQMRQSFEGTAIAIAMGGSALPSDKKFAISTNWGTFRGQNAMSLGAQMRLSEYVVVNSGVAAGFAQGGVGGRAGVIFAW